MGLETSQPSRDLLPEALRTLGALWQCIVGGGGLEPTIRQ